jgi:hypothetical protein
VNKWLWSVLSGVILVPAIAFNWAHIGKVWATPSQTEQNTRAISTMAETQRQIVDLQQKADSRLARIEVRQEASEKISSIQTQALKDSIGILKELVDRKR